MKPRSPNVCEKMTACNTTSVRLFLSAVAIIAVGCGGPEATLTGKVMVDDKPLSNGRINFVPSVEGGTVAVATIESDGTYSARTGGQPGMAAGNYKITVSSFGPGVPDPNGGPPQLGKSLIPDRYRSAKSSGLTHEVKSGENTHDFALSSEDDTKGKKRRR